ncbi:MAG: hypothetical protein NZ483_03200 [Verrucomicrobiae bacterium]|nr:hypothetical protein [Verrucomicrobiae bacterium]MDW8343233.1 hypothetical protein [Verrucomicrobiae bacterium]
MATQAPPSPEEIQQLRRTVEMFEAITESQPDDYQSLEILKEAYAKLGQHDDLRRISLKLASAYQQVGQLSQAILEYEGLLQRNPNDAEARAALAEIESKTSQLRVRSESIAAAETTTAAPVAPSAASRSHARDALAGAQVLAEILVTEKLSTRQALAPLLERLKSESAAASARGEPLTLVQLILDQQLVKFDDLFEMLVAKSGKPFLPLSWYDVDRDAVLLLPREICFRYCIVPFDLISRSVLIATCNPFDDAARTEVESLLDYNLFWYLSPPAEITTALRAAYSLDGKTGKGGR